MTIGKDLIFSDKQAVTITAASTKDINSVQKGTPYKGMYLFVKLDEAFATLTSLTIALLHSSDEFVSDSSVVFQKVFLLAELTPANTVIWKVPIPSSLEKDLRVQYTVTGTTATAGKVTALLVGDVDEGF